MRLRIAAAAAVLAVALAALGGIALGRPGSSPDPAGGSPGVLGEVLDELVDDGTLTREQADAVEEGVAARRAEHRAEHRAGRGWSGERGWFGESRGPGEPSPSGRGHGHAFGLGAGRLGEHLDRLAEELETTVEELRAELRSGKTLREIAADHGVDADEVVAALVDGMRQALDAMVDAGLLTQAQADRHLERFEDHADRLLDTPRR
jgi:hypothetical protein